MWSKGYNEIILVSVKREGIDRGWARTNPQGVVLQSAPIAPKYIDYAIKISLTNDGQWQTQPCRDGQLHRSFDLSLQTSINALSPPPLSTHAYLIRHAA
jgi:hypothetical protein